jgi:uncharacterized protein (DUF58 family)
MATREAANDPRGGAVSGSGASAFDPAVLDRLSRLSFVARTVVEGFMAGGHRSPRRGSSVEFAQHREYVAGDDPRYIDERIFARSDRLVVKEFVAETNFALHLLVDASASMGFSSGKWSKLDYSRWCAAALAYLVLQQRDTAGLVVFDSKARTKVPPGNGAAQAAAILASLETARPSGETRVGEVLSWIGTRLKSRGIVAIFSDFLDEPAAVLDGVRRLALAGHEPILFQVLDPRELDFEYAGNLRLEDLEGPGRIQIDAKSIREAYREEVEAHASALRRGAAASGLDFVPINTATGVDVVLSAYLARRMARARDGRR